MANSTFQQRLEKIFQTVENHQIESDDKQYHGDTENLQHWSKRNLGGYGTREETCRSLFTNGADLLDDILDDPLSIDYFNVFLSLPIFGQRLLRHRQAEQYEHDPPAIVSPLDHESKKWLICCRLPHYLQTDIYIESLVAVWLIQSKPLTDRSLNSISTPSALSLPTVASVRQFHQFLQSTTGIKYWDFAIDTLRLLRSRYFSHATRIDNSPLNYLYKYSIRANDFSSIMISQASPFLISDPNGSDAISFTMAIKAINQLRDYWVLRYLCQQSAGAPRDDSKKIGTDVPSHKPSVIEETVQSKIHQEDARLKRLRTKIIRLENMSYINYNPQQYVVTQTELDHPYRDPFDQIQTRREISETVTNDEPMRKSIADLINSEKLEFFYPIIASDVLAGWPFSAYLTRVDSKNHLSNYLRFMADVEMIRAIESNIFKDRLLRHLIARYLQYSSIKPLSMDLFDQDEEQRWSLIHELTLLPHYIQYTQYDRLRFLSQGQPIQQSLTNDTIRRHFPFIDFDPLRRNDQSKGKTTLSPHWNENDPSRKSNCWNESMDLATTEKSINTDEQCPNQIKKRFLPLKDEEINEELEKLCQEFHWHDVKNTLGPSFDVVSINDLPSFVGNPPSPPVSKPLGDRYEDPAVLAQVDIYTSDILRTSRELFEIDQFVADIIHSGIDRVYFDLPRDSIETNTSSTPLSPLFDEILQTDSSSTIITSSFARHFTDNFNHNALMFDPMSSESTQDKICSEMGGYFINNPNVMDKRIEHQLDPVLYAYLKENERKSIETFSLDSKHSGRIKELTIDRFGMAELSFHLTETTLKFDQLNSLLKSARVRVYTDDDQEFLSALIKSFSFDSSIKENVHLILDDLQLPGHSSVAQPTRVPSITDDLRYVPKDQSIETHEIIPYSSGPYLHPSDEEELMNFIVHRVNFDQWPLEEFISRDRNRSWRAFEFAKAISRMEFSAINDNYDRTDWLARDDNLGSFSEGNGVEHVQRASKEHYIIPVQSNYNRGQIRFSCMDEDASSLID